MAVELGAGDILLTTAMNEVILQKVVIRPLSYQYINGKASVGAAYGLIWKSVFEEEFCGVRGRLHAAFGSGIGLFLLFLVTSAISVA